MARPVPEVERELDERVEALGFELVQVEWAGSDRRPILRIRIDVPDSVAGGHGGVEGQEGVTLADCASVSRGLEPWLDALEALSERYTLEVSSPGIERPLRRTRDWTRFAGEQVAVKGPEKLAGRATRLEGELLGLIQGESGREIVRLKLPGGDEVEIPREEIEGAHIVYRWK